MQCEGKQKLLAKESQKTLRAREKLKRQMDALDRKITPQALEKKMIEIHRWIASHASYRIVLKSKSICLFDENQNTAELSQRVTQLAETIKKEMNGLAQEASIRSYTYQS